MNRPSHRPSGPADDDSLDAAALRLREEMETALRHLREQAWTWPVSDGPDYRPADGDGDIASQPE